MMINDAKGRHDAVLAMLADGSPFILLVVRQAPGEEDSVRLLTDLLAGDATRVLRRVAELSDLRLQACPSSERH